LPGRFSISAWRLHERKGKERVILSPQRQNKNENRSRGNEHKRAWDEKATPYLSWNMSGVVAELKLIFFKMRFVSRFGFEMN
jgi:hypothetical protein